MRLAVFGALVTILLVIGCGKNNSTTCSTSPLLGTWQDGGSAYGTTDQITFNSNCTATEQVCGEAITFSNSTANTGTVTFNITSASNSSGVTGCPSVGTYYYTYSVEQLSNSTTLNLSSSKPSYSDNFEKIQ